jgi:hypothetical protein
MIVFVTMVNDRHSDPEPFVFSTPEAAIAYAEQAMREYATHPESIEVQPTPRGWLFYGTYSNEDDGVWVLEKTIDDPAGSSSGATT